MSVKNIFIFFYYLFTFYQLWRISTVISGGELYVNSTLLKFPCMYTEEEAASQKKSEQKQTIRKSKCNNKHSPLLLLLLCREVIINSDCSVMMIIMIIAVCVRGPRHTLPATCLATGCRHCFVVIVDVVFLFVVFSWGFG